MASRLLALDDGDDGGLILGLLVKLPAVDHRTVCIASPRLNFMLKSEPFRKQRSKLRHGHGQTVDCWMLAGGR